MMNFFKKQKPIDEPQMIRHFDVTVRVHFTDLVQDNDPMLHKIATTIADGETLTEFPVNEVTFVEYEVE